MKDKEIKYYVEGVPNSFNNEMEQVDEEYSKFFEEKYDRQMWSEDEDGKIEIIK